MGVATLEGNLAKAAARWSEIPSLAPLAAAFTRTMGVHETIKVKAAEIAQDKHKSALGKKDTKQKYIAEIGHELLRARKVVAAAKTKLAERKAKLLPTEPSPMDTEMRQALFRMKDSERDKLLYSDPAFQEAALRGHPALSGLTNQVRDVIATKVIERRHPGALKEIELAQEAIELVEVAARVAFDSANEAGEFQDKNALTSFIEDSVGPTGALDADVERSLASLASVEGIAA